MGNTIKKIILYTILLNYYRLNDITAVAAAAAIGSHNIVSLIAKANIYCLRPFGEPNETTLDNIDELPMDSDIKVIIHGFLGSRTHSSIRPLRNAYMAKGVNNVFVADWQNAANLDYYNSRKAIGKVAIYFGKMLNDFFNKHNISLSDVHIIGHSLGAHIAGDIGVYFNGTLGRVTGLDPALPLFTPHADDSLHANAAQFVDVIHTDYPVFGDITPRGTADFYPNFGHAPQHGCDDLDLLTASKFIFEAYSCSHNRAVILYAESVGLPNNFPSIPCNLNGIKLRNAATCLRKLADVNGDITTGSLLNNNQIVYMGEEVSKSANGIYYLDTFDAPPYGMGANAKF